MTSIKSTELLNYACKYIGQTSRFHRHITSTTNTPSLHRAATKVKEHTSNVSLIQQPVVTRQNGKWVRIEGSTNALLNFTSNDVFGIQNHTELSETELKTMSVSGLSSNYKYYYQSLPAQKSLEEKLSLLHRKESTILSTDSFVQTLHSWLKKVDKDQQIYVHDGCDMVDDCLVAGRFSSVNDLRDNLKGKSNKSNLIIVQAGSNMESIRELEKVCKFADSQNASVLLLDPYGIILIRHVLGDVEETLDILQRPTMIQTTLDLIHGQDSLTYITGPKTFKDWCTHALTSDVQVIGTPLIARTLKAIELLPFHYGKVYGALLHSMKLKQELEKIGLTVQGDAMELMLHLDSQCCQMVSEDLRKNGHHVALVNEGQHTGIKISINGHHEEKDINKFKIDLLKSLASHEVINAEEIINNTSKLAGQQSLRELLEMNDLNPDKGHNKAAISADELSIIDNIYHTGSAQHKLNPQHLQQDLKWLKSLYCTSMFDEMLQNNISSHFDYKS